LKTNDWLLNAIAIKNGVSGRSRRADSCRHAVAELLSTDIVDPRRYAYGGPRFDEEVSVSTSTTLISAEAYLRMPDNGQPTELVLGEVITMPPPTPRHGEICFRVGYLLQRYLDDRPLGRIVTNDAAVITERDPDTVRGPDVAFYSYVRVPKGPLPLGYLHVPPEVVFEVRSPSERWGEIVGKVAEYFAAGISVVCVLDEEKLSAHVFSADATPRFVGADQELTLTENFPDLRLIVRRFFE
jgi:Uma2 family endonuclease